MSKYEDNPDMNTFYKRCRFGNQLQDEEYYCLCATSEHTSTMVSNADDSICSKCEDFFSFDDTENMKNNDEDTEVLPYDR